MRVFLTGGTGFLGRAIIEQLLARDDEVVVLSRDAARASASLPDTVAVIEGDPQYAGNWQSQVAECDAIINLAGESIAGRRWDARFKQVLHDSRVDTTARLVEALGQSPSQSRCLISASGVDYYPWAEELDHHTARFEDDPVDESFPPGSSFLARLCRHWEEEAHRAAEISETRVVTMRTGLVLGRGGALDRLETPFKLFVGGRVGSGKQWTSWIHVLDAARAYVFAVHHSSLVGPVNLVAPGNVRNRELSRLLGRSLSRPSWFPVPSPALKLALGEFADYVLHGRRVVPSALESAAFEFTFPELEEALDELY